MYNFIPVYRSGEESRRSTTKSLFITVGQPFLVAFGLQDLLHINANQIYPLRVKIKLAAKKQQQAVHCRKFYEFI